jgi:hypothetical protein
LGELRSISVIFLDVYDPEASPSFLFALTEMLSRLTPECWSVRKYPLEPFWEMVEFTREGCKRAGYIMS